MNNKNAENQCTFFLVDNHYPPTESCPPLLLVQVALFKLTDSFSQCCSQDQNPKAKDEAKVRTLKAEAEAKAWTLETKTKARTLESKVNFKAKYDSKCNANIPHAIDMTIAPSS